MFLGTATIKVGDLEKKVKEGGDAIEVTARVDQKKREDSGFGSVHSNMQRRDALGLNYNIGEKISQFCIIDMDKAGAEKNLPWMHREW